MSVDCVAPATPANTGAVPAPRWRDAELVAATVSGIRPSTVLEWTRTYPTLGAALAAHRDMKVTVTEHQVADLLGADGFVLTRDDPAYPTGLRGVPSPPALLFARGNRALLTGPAVAVNGTRSPSRLGTTVAEAAASAAAHCGAPVVTGGARGVDETATLAGIQFGATPILIPATGPDAHPLTAQVTDGGGLVVSEHPYGTTTDTGLGYTPAPYPARLIARNRIIVGLGALLIPASGTFRSGTAQAVWTALGIGRPVVVAKPRPHAETLSDAQLPAALAHPQPVTVAQLRAAGCPAQVAAGLAGHGPLAHAVAHDTDELAAAVDVLWRMSPDQPPTRTAG